MSVGSRLENAGFQVQLFTDAGEDFVLVSFHIDNRPLSESEFRTALHNAFGSMFAIVNADPVDVETQIRADGTISAATFARADLDRGV